MKLNGILHQYNSRYVAFQFDNDPKPEKALIFIGGLTDGLLTVPYAPGLSEHLSRTCNYSTFQIQMKSSFEGWGTSSLDADVKSIEELVTYLKTEIGVSKVIIMGHSTGSQDVIHYILNANTKVDAGIMQASVSDREAVNINSTEKGKQLNEEALHVLRNEKKDVLLSNKHRKHMFNTPITAYRWNSLVNKGGDDDYFSSDLSEDELKFVNIDVPFLIAYSENDECVPENIDKNDLINRWKQNSNAKYWSENSGLIKNANHNVKELASQNHLFQMVSAFINEFNL